MLGEIPPKTYAICIRVAGGKPGAIGENYVIHPDQKVTKLSTKGQIEVKKDDIFVLKTPGGGGYNFAK